MQIKKLSKQVIIIEKFKVINPTNFNIGSTEVIKNSPKDDNNIINKCPAVKLLDNRRAILTARVHLPIISINGRNRLKTIGIVHVTLPTTVYTANTGSIPNINPNPTKVTSPINNNVSQLPLSLIKGQIEINVFMREGNPIKTTIIAPISK